MSNKNMLDLIQATLSAKVTECQNEVREYAKAEVERYLTSAFIVKTIQEEIKNAIPQAVLDVLMKDAR